MDLINPVSIKYKNSPDGSGRNIEVIYPIELDENGNERADRRRRKLCVPIAEDNTEYQEIMKWVAEGNTIEEAD
tara:strand:+ start:1081 stop:1302 length:222 start_codon:yes stop_codon:yes gene_type:complete